VDHVKIAIISDIHSNREALDAVFAHIDTQSVDKVFCLGDVIGYGPEPEYCVDVIRERCEVSLMGNHDDGLFHGASDFNPHARGALEFTRKRMRPHWYNSRIVKRRWAWLQERPLSVQEGRFLFVHGSPRDPVREYVLSTDGFLNPGKLRSIFDSFEGIAFAGHTHHGGVLDSGFKFHGLSGERETTFDFEDDGQYFVNVGSVGQPRDGDSRACYAILEPTRVTWHRVVYDYRATQGKIRSYPALSEILASRLAMGR
jgi:diadenosine tetraphosphatase ApaH/serine/threonine PP2A family protein phosphatase